MKPPIPLTDPRFKYVNAASTDIRETFRRIRAELEVAKAQERKVTVIRKRAP